MEKKMTKREMFEQIKANYPLTAEEIEFIDHELALLVKKNERKSNKPTKLQVANENLKECILTILTTDGRQCKEIAEVLNITPQKASALLNQLVKENKAEKVIVKRITYFKRVA